MKRIVLLLLLFPTIIYARQVTLLIPDSLRSISSVSYTIQDIAKLLHESGNTLVVNPNSSVDTSSHILQVLSPQTMHENYIWTYSLQNQTHVYKLESQSIEAVSHGLYGFLQEVLHFSFYHLKETKKPDSLIFPKKSPWSFTARARFSKRGFHIHSQHPLELTPFLLDHKNGEKGQQEVREYLDWLARNGQNYFQFKLLESINLDAWVSYFLPIAQYAQARNIQLGVDISLHQIQQKAFTLYKNFPVSWKSKNRQIEENLEKLTQIPWNYANVDFKTHEFSKNQSNWLFKKKDLAQKIFASKYVQMMEHYHIVNNAHLNTSDEVNDSIYLTRVGHNFHTVMFYSLKDAWAPVYENENFSHIYQPLCQKAKDPETWFFPESAYWCTFDNSVPMFLSSYLNARLEDIQTCDSLGVQTHVTFSSGWEWGYWIIDHSIARWSWQYSSLEVESPYQFLDDLPLSAPEKSDAIQAMNIQDHFLKKKNLISYLTAMSPTDELPEYIFNKEFQPRPYWSYKYIQNKANQEILDSIVQFVLKPLTEYIDQSWILLHRLTSASTKDDRMNEWYLSMQITVVRAEHRREVLRYILMHRQEKISKKSFKIEKEEAIEKAQKIRQKAQDIVLEMEQTYRYPLEQIARKNKNLTAYAFGYLYPVSNLHFWQREEKQAIHNRYSAFYENIWDVLRIAGIRN